MTMSFIKNFSVQVIRTWIMVLILATTTGEYMRAEYMYLKNGMISLDNLPSVTEESKDEAYEKPSSSLIGTWLSIFQENAYEFDFNGILNYSYPSKKVEGITLLLSNQWTWKKTGDKLILTPIAGKRMVYKIDPSLQNEYDSLSARRKNNVLEFIKSANASTHILPGLTMEIEMLTDDILVLNGEYFIRNTSVDKILKQIEEIEAEKQQQAEEQAFRERNAREEALREQEKMKLAEEKEPIYDEVDETPRLKRENTDWNRYALSHLKYPQAAYENNIQGTVIVKFAVMKDGSVDKIHVVQSVDPDLDREAMRVIKILPEFIPAKKNGQSVKAWLTFSPRFRLQN